MDSDVMNILAVSRDEKTQYDTLAKMLLAQRDVLSNILAATVDEFKGMSPEEIEGHIDGEVLVGNVPVDPGMTNKARMVKGKRVVEFGNVQSERLEGTAIYDIVFYVTVKDETSKIIINIEAQKDDPSGYDILNRAIFYVSRLVSSQKERDFTGRNFNDLKRVYSIWICMNMDECIWNYVHLTDDAIMANHKWKGKIDMLNIVLLGLPNTLPEQGEEYRLHRLLTTMFSLDLTFDERVEILENEYGIPARTELREELTDMCNLSQGILEKGIERGIERGEMKKAKETALTLHEMNMPVDQIAKAVKVSVAQVNEWLGLALA